MSTKIFYALIVVASVFVLFQACETVQLSCTLHLTLMFQLPLRGLVGFHTSKPHLPGVRTGVDPLFTADVSRRDAVVEAFKVCVHLGAFTYDSLISICSMLGRRTVSGTIRSIPKLTTAERDAMGDDEYHPLSHRGSNLTQAGGIGYTVVDSIDTMLIMGLRDEYQRARKWVQDHLSFDRDAKFSTFEARLMTIRLGVQCANAVFILQTTIRVLGGLLAAYHLSEEDPIFLDKAQELGDRILPVFETPSGLPLSFVNLQRKEGVPDHDNSGFVSTAEAATLQLEFRYLSYLTDEDIYWEKAEEVSVCIFTTGYTVSIMTGYFRPQNSETSTWSCTHIYRVCVIDGLCNGHSDLPPLSARKVVVT